MDAELPGSIWGHSLPENSMYGVPVLCSLCLNTLANGDLWFLRFITLSDARILLHIMEWRVLVLML